MGKSDEDTPCLQIVPELGMGSRPADKLGLIVDHHANSLTSRKERKL